MKCPRPPELPLLGMTCANCAHHRAPPEQVDGVLSATVNYANEKAAVPMPGRGDRADLVAAVRRAGYDVVESAATTNLEDAEAAAREAEIKHQQRRLIVGVLFSLPCFC
jgi:Cu+-exporting ATPase